MTKPENTIFQSINEKTKARYDSRFQEHGNSPKSLGWGSVSDQHIRFQAFCDLTDWRDSHLVDFGCGFADLLGFLKSKGNAPKQYTGIDLSQDFVTVASERYPDARFLCNEDGLNWSELGEVDTVVMLGLMNFKQKTIPNLDYARTLIETHWNRVRKGVVSDFLSQSRTEDYAEEDWVHYYSPNDVVKLALSFSQDFVLKHDYPPNPQREMMLWIRKSST